MALGNFAKRLLGARQPQQGEPSGEPNSLAPVDIDLHRSEPMSTDADQSVPVQSDADDWRPIIIGTVHSPLERATLFIEAMIEAGFEGKSIYENDLCEFHRRICLERGWALLNWGSMLRALGPKGLNLRLKRKLHTDIGRLTMYAIRKPEAAAVVELAAAKAKRA